MNLSDIKDYSTYLDYCDLYSSRHKNRRGFLCKGCKLKGICYDPYGHKNDANYILEKVFQKIRKEKLGKLLEK